MKGCCAALSSRFLLTVGCLLSLKRGKNSYIIFLANVILGNVKKEALKLSFPSKDFEINHVKISKDIFVCSEQLFKVIHYLETIFPI